ncbi:GlxA family transcriptional regulator [Geopsychrobacter electrodiphilus]|uniref:GlxA family transcriptional regulator n=1 Tax=Geopsychrobacter electrodiphilus TaxID=225196 RepID=UPI00036C9ABF|nr:helix-turn-helix domain-containing protein [Geopsychrobacter electrodiphilus]
MLNVAILAFDNCLQSSIAGPLDLFTVANWEKKKRNKTDPSPFCRWEVLTVDGGPVVCFSQDPLVPHCSIHACRQPDLIILPSVLGNIEALRQEKQAIAWLKDQHARGVVIASICAGAFLSAEAGILNGREATTHWQLAERFRQTYPKVKLQADQILIDGGDYICAGGTSAHQDLAIYLLEKYGSTDLADSCARMMLIDRVRRQQAPYIRFRRHKNHGDESIALVQRHLEQHLTDRTSVVEMAGMAQMVERTFLRRFKKATGDSPLEYLQRLRVEAAKRLLERGETRIELITGAVGYEDASSFRRLFKQIVGVSPTVYRRRFVELRGG